MKRINKKIVEKIKDDLSQGKHERAIKIAEKYIKNQSNSEICLGLGWAYDQSAIKEKNGIIQKDLQKKALTCFKKAKKIDRFSALRGIGTVYHHQYKLPYALANYREALQLQRKNPLIHNDLGNVYQRLGTTSLNKGLSKKYYRLSKIHYLKSIQLVTKKDPLLTISPLINLALLSKKQHHPSLSKRYATQALRVIKKNTNNSALVAWMPIIQEILT